MEFKAKVLYDFIGEAENELSVREGDIVTVTNTEVGEGWWFGLTSDGKEGIFPTAYVEKADDRVVLLSLKIVINLARTYKKLHSHTVKENQIGLAYSGFIRFKQIDRQEDKHNLLLFYKDCLFSELMPPPPPSIVTSNVASYTAPDPGWSTLGTPVQNTTDSAVRKTSVSSFNDDWNSTDEESVSTTVQQPYSVQAVQQSTNQVITTEISRPPLQKSDSIRSTGDKGDKKGGFKLFGKSSSFDNFLCGAIESSATTVAEAVDIIDVTGFLYWKPSTSQYTCTIGVPKKGAKFGGLKAYMTYPVTPSFNNIQVSRRYKHFDWLHARLTAKYGATIAIPPLPEKQITGRFEEELIENRRIELQSFADRICRHPVLSQSAVWRHFITETNEKQWTAGKRKAESDNLIGTDFLTTLQAPEEDRNEEIITEFKTTLGKVENAVKILYAASLEQENRYRTTNKKDMVSLGHAFSLLGSSLNSRVPPLEKIGDSFCNVAEVMETHASKAWDPIVHLLHDYKGLAASWTEILNAYFSCRDRQKELEATAGDKERFIARSRINLYRIGVMCEINHFLQEVETDLNHASQVLIYEQMTHYKDMADKMESLYANCWGGGAVQQQQPQQQPTAVIQAKTINLDPWGNDGIYEEMP